MKAEQGMNERGLARSVWPEQADGTPAQLSRQVF
jgi:hypothetical protein